MYLFIRNVACECNFALWGKKLNKTLKPCKKSHLVLGLKRT